MSQHYTYSKGIVYMPVMHAAIVETTVSKTQLVAGAKAIGIEFSEAGTVNNRSGVLTITVSLDGGETFHAYSMLISNAANTNAQSPIRVGSVTRASAGADIMWLDPATLGAITHIKSTVTITDGADPTGNFNVKASISY